MGCCVSALLQLLQVMSHSCLCRCYVQVSECFEYRGHVWIGFWALGTTQHLCLQRWKLWASVCSVWWVYQPLRCPQASAQLLQLPMATAACQAGLSFKGGGSSHTPSAQCSLSWALWLFWSLLSNKNLLNPSTALGQSQPWDIWSVQCMLMEYYLGTALSPVRYCEP